MPALPGDSLRRRASRCQGACSFCSRLLVQKAACIGFQSLLSDFLRCAGLAEAFLTGGLPPGIHLPCAAQDAYRCALCRLQFRDKALPCAFWRKVAFRRKQRGVDTAALRWRAGHCSIESCGRTSATIGASQATWPRHPSSWHTRCCTMALSGDISWQLIDLHLRSEIYKNRSVCDVFP